MTPTSNDIGVRVLDPLATMLLALENVVAHANKNRKERSTMSEAMRICDEGASTRK